MGSVNNKCFLEGKDPGAIAGKITGLCTLGKETAINKVMNIKTNLKEAIENESKKLSTSI